MAAEENPPINEWYPELIYGIDGEPDEAEKANALEVVRLAMGGIEEAIRRGLIEDVELSFEILGELRQGFTFSAGENGV
jgi:hypothetical protein